MTDKQIIIDGVDVSGCECLMADGFDFPQCRWEIQQSSFSSACEQHDNCYYKQLKAKEQECEELKKGLNLILTVQKNCKECPHQKLDVDVLVCDLDCATAFKKITKQTLKKLENKNV